MDSIYGDYLTTAQVARRLGITPIWVRELAKQRRLPCVQTPLGRLFDATAIERLAAERELQASQPETVA